MELPYEVYLAISLAIGWLIGFLLQKTFYKPKPVTLPLLIYRPLINLRYNLKQRKMFSQVKLKLIQKRSQ